MLVFIAFLLREDCYWGGGETDRPPPGVSDPGLSCLLCGGRGDGAPLRAGTGTALPSLLRTRGVSARAVTFLLTVLRAILVLLLTLLLGITATSAATGVAATPLGYGREQRRSAKECPRQDPRANSEFHNPLLLGLLYPLLVAPSVPLSFPLGQED